MSSATSIAAEGLRSGPSRAGTSWFMATFDVPRPAESIALGTPARGAYASSSSAETIAAGGTSKTIRN